MALRPHWGGCRRHVSTLTQTAHLNTGLPCAVSQQHGRPTGTGLPRSHAVEGSPVLRSHPGPVHAARPQAPELHPGATTQAGSVLGISTKAEKSPFLAETPAAAQGLGPDPQPQWLEGHASPRSTACGHSVRAGRHRSHTLHVPGASRPPSPDSMLAPGHTAAHWGSPAASVIRAFPVCCSLATPGSQEYTLPRPRDRRPLLWDTTLGSHVPSLPSDWGPHLFWGEMFLGLWGYGVGRVAPWPCARGTPSDTGLSRQSWGRGKLPGFPALRSSARHSGKCVHRAEATSGPTPKTVPPTPRPSPNSLCPPGTLLPNSSPTRNSGGGCRS